MEIVFKDVSYTYNKGTSLEKEVINKFNLEFKKEAINGIIGSNGSGKTTLIQMINGLIVPNVGSVNVGSYIVNSKNKDYKDLRFDVGLVFQRPEEQIFNLTV